MIIIYCKFSMDRLNKLKIVRYTISIIYISWMLLISLSLLYYKHKPTLSHMSILDPVIYPMLLLNCLKCCIFIVLRIPFQNFILASRKLSILTHLKIGFALTNMSLKFKRWNILNNLFLAFPLFIIPQIVNITNTFPVIIFLACSMFFLAIKDLTCASIVIPLIIYCAFTNFFIIITLICFKI